MKVSPRRVARTEMFVNSLLSWGTKNRQRFAWRKKNGPYEILIAELLLQRTKAKQAERVYTEFIKKFPDARTLADAPLEDVANVIKPLGLAYRAQRIKDIALNIVQHHGGNVPRSEEELVKLRGIGRYTANAILCFAFGKNVPVVDVNVARVIQRVFGVKFGNTPHKNKKLWELMSRIIPEGQARDFNLSILDLAQLICTPRHPQCSVCPLNGLCLFYRRSHNHASL